MSPENIDRVIIGLLFFAGLGMAWLAWQLQDLCDEIESIHADLACDNRRMIAAAERDATLSDRLYAVESLLRRAPVIEPVRGMRCEGDNDHLSN